VGGACRAKLSTCGSFTILTQARFILVDNRPPAASAAQPRLTFTVLAGGSLANGTAAPLGNGTYEAHFPLQSLGAHVLAVFLDGAQIPNSPFLLDVAQRACPAGSLRVPDAAGACVCASGAVEVAGSCAAAAHFYGAAAAALAATVALACAAGRLRERQKAAAGEDGAFLERVEALRARLALTRQEGFKLATDSVPTWRRAAAAAAAAAARVLGGGGPAEDDTVYLHRSQLEAAARLWLLREDADAKLVNGLCACVIGHPRQLRRLRDWLLEVARALLDPPPPPPRAGPARPVAARRRSSARLGEQPLRRERTLGEEEEEWRRSRFQYFQDKVAKVMSGWVDCVGGKLAMGGESGRGERGGHVGER
jgi:hypothetical protein